MGRIEWSQYSGQDIENLIAYLLCSEYPDARQRKPSRGDQGIDVFRRTPAGLVVWQVKGFTGQLMPSHKKQIQHSWTTLSRHVHRRGLQLAEWHVIRPENSTDENDEWLSAMVGDHDAVIDWMGLANIVPLAAKYPAVVDWYIGNDRDRTRQEINEVLRAVNLMHHVENGELSEPGRSVESYQALGKTLNRRDPHFLYEVHIERSDMDPSTARPRPGHVGDVMYRAGEQQVRFSIFARNAASLDERPIRGKMVIQVARGSTQERQVRDFLRFGLPMENIPLVRLEIDLPGGLADQSTAITHISMLPEPVRDPSQRDDMILEVLSPDGSVLKTLEAQLDPPTRGSDGGEAVARRGRERRSVFSVEQRIDPDADVLLHFELLDLDKCHLEDVLLALGFLAKVTAPNTLRMRARLDPRDSMSAACPQDAGLAKAAVRLAEMAEGLMALRDACGVDLRMPGRGGATVDAAMNIDFARSVVERSDSVQAWISLGAFERPFVVPATQLLTRDVADGARVAVSGRRPLVLEYGGTSTALGGFVWACPATARYLVVDGHLQAVEFHCDPTSAPGLQMTWLGMNVPPNEIFISSEPVQVLGEGVGQMGDLDV